MIYIAICDDETVFQENAFYVLEQILSPVQLKHEIHIFQDGEDFLNTKLPWNLVLLDIEMKRISGFLVRDKMRKDPIFQKCAIIYITSYTEMMAEAFGQNVIGFLSKPVKTLALKRLLAPVLEDWVDERTITLGSDTIYLKEILYIVAQDKYSEVVTLRGSVWLRLSMYQVEKQLPASDFARVHKSYIVHLKYVESFIPHRLRMTNGMEIACSRYRVSNVRERYIKYMTKHTQN